MSRARSRSFIAAASTVVCLFAVGGGGAGIVTGCGSGVEPAIQDESSDLRDYGCCKICTIGKACGDTCISRAYDCHVGAGCACNG